MRRAAFSVLAFLSMLLFIAAGVFWVRGQFVSDYATRVIPDSQLGLSTSRRLVTSRSGVAFIYLDGLSGTRYGTDAGWILSEGPAVSVSGLIAVLEETEIDFLHVIYLSQNNRVVMPSTVRALHIPHWLILILTLPAPLAWVIRYHRPARRLRLGLCVKCGYDLRGSAAKCPECGAVRASA